MHPNSNAGWYIPGIYAILSEDTVRGATFRVSAVVDLDKISSQTRTGAK
jgi:hypothetical protein